jgi:hypothetical protein
MTGSYSKFFFPLLPIWLLATLLTLCLTSCVVPENLIQYEEKIITEKQCPLITSVLPEKNVLTLAVYEEVSFTINVIDPDEDDISISLIINNQEKLFSKGQGEISFNYVYQVVPRDFEDADYIEVQAIIYDEGCTLNTVDWAIFLAGG